MMSMKKMLRFDNTGMNVISQSTLNKNGIQYFITTGYASGNIITKWITIDKQWDFIVYIKPKKGDIIYKDSNNKRIRVFEETDPEFNDW